MTPDIKQHLTFHMMKTAESVSTFYSFLSHILVIVFYILNIVVKPFNIILTCIDLVKFYYMGSQFNQNVLLCIIMSMLLPVVQWTVKEKNRFMIILNNNYSFLCAFICLFRIIRDKHAFVIIVCYLMQSCARRLDFIAIEACACACLTFKE